MKKLLKNPDAFIGQLFFHAKRYAYWHANTNTRSQKLKRFSADTRGNCFSNHKVAKVVSTRDVL